MNYLLLAHVAATLFMTGLIWFVQIVHYPLLSSVGADAFVAYENRHRNRTLWVVAPPMLTELITGGLLLAANPTGPYRLGAGLLAIIWLSTLFLQARDHEKLSAGFDAALHRRLVQSNWIRTVAWTLRVVIVLQAIR